MKKFLFLSVLSVFFALSAPSFAESPAIVEVMTIQEVSDLLAEEGYRPEIDDETACSFKIQGYNAQIILYNEGEALQFHISWIETDATLDSLNSWNESYRFGRAYMDDKGNPHLEVDLDLAGGVTRDRIKDYLKTCQGLLISFSKEAI